jgi:hypothetical protein
MGGLSARYAFVRSELTRSVATIEIVKMKPMIRTSRTDGFMISESMEKSMFHRPSPEHRISTQAYDGDCKGKFDASLEPPSRACRSLPLLRGT